MIAAWMLCVLFVGTLLGLGAWSADAVLRSLGRPARWAWTAALVGLVALAAALPVRELVRRMDAAGITQATVPAATLAAPAAGAAAEVSRPTTSALLAHLVGEAARLVPGEVGRALGVGWIALTLVTLLAFTLAYLRLRRARGGWPAGEVAGSVVRLTPSGGPAVVGLRHPEIIVPRWLLDRDAAEQRLALAHEVEHLRARDHWLLAAGCTAAALLPWHPAAWWMLAQLRLAVEVDCDGRVLGRGFDRRSYGSLLIEMAGGERAFPSPALALRGRDTQLERRLIAMTPIRSFGRLGRVRATLLATLGAAAILVACEARLPTDAEVQSMDAAHAEKLYKLVPDGGPAAATTNPGYYFYYVDGHRVTAAQAHAIPASRIATVEVVGPRAAPAGGTVSTETRGAVVARLEAERHAVIVRDTGPLPAGEGSSGQPEIRITTIPENGAASVENGLTLRAHGLTEESGRTTTRGNVSTLDEHGFTGLLYIDGKRADAAALHSLDPAGIASVEVLKGARAQAVSSDPAAANGIIRVTTKK